LGVNRFTPDPSDALPLERVIVQRHAKGDAGLLRVPEVCRYARRVRVVAQYRSLDGRHALYILEAPDAELVRELLRGALPGEEVAIWKAARVD
jgi:hypothetical protein